MDEPLRAELVEMMRVDQQAALACAVATEAAPDLQGKFVFQIPRSQWLPEFERFEELARPHTQRLAEIIDKHGWPGRRLVGPEGAYAAWIVLQHADHDNDFRRRCLSHLKTAVDSGDADPEWLAAVTDRVAMVDGRGQCYGTHLRLENGRLVPLVPIEDVENVDQRRAKIGLDGWAEYLGRLTAGSRPSE